ncbi:MAG: FtsX-like permease family protein [Oscillospiraceae bacterium]|nr:FtsX-like permease family protein [Oscillospiraceae bacterium]
MFKTIFSLAFQGIKRRRHQSLLIFFVLLVSFTFAIILLSYTSSIAETNTQLRYDTYGWWYGAITDTNESTKEYLKSTEWIDEVGTSVNYGSASVMVANMPMGSLAIGTADDNLADMGINLESGHLPNSSGQIAVEAAALSEVGYGTSTGSTITLQWSFAYYDAETGKIYSTTVEREFTIVGVIKEYTSLWNVDCTLNSAIITEEDMADIIAEAEEILGGSVALVPETNYFFTVKSGTESDIEDGLAALDRFLFANRVGYDLRFVTINSVIGVEEEVAETNMVYLILILAITVLAVVMIYILQMQSDVRRIVRFRSIGASKWQIRFLILTETLLLAVPAIIFGIGLGFLGIQGLLKLSVYTGSTTIVVSIPWNYLLLALVLWIVGILAVRMITFQVALATPLTGRMGMQRSKTRLLFWFRRALIMLMATIMCISVVFSTINIAKPLDEYNYWSSQWSYYLSRYSLYSSRGDFSLPDLSGYEEKFLSVDGVTDFVGFDHYYALTTDSNGNNLSAVVITMDWDDLQKYVDTTGVDQEAYESGESVIIQANTTSLAAMNPPELNSDLTISIDYEYLDGYDDSISKSPALNESILESDGLVSVSANVGAVQLVESGETLISKIQYSRSDTFSLAKYSYFVICSIPLVQDIVDQIPEGTEWWIDHVKYLDGQQEVGYTQAFIYTNMKAGNLETDGLMTSIVSQIARTITTDVKVVLSPYYTLYNSREENYAKAQVYMQSIIQTLVSGVCIALVVLMILVSTLRLETESEKKRYGILQAIGMSRRQRNLELIRRSLVRSISAVALAVGSYLGYYLLQNRKATKAMGAKTVIGWLIEDLNSYGLTNEMMLQTLAVTLLITFIICFGTKLSLNRYSLMEMLREDR